MKGSIRSHSRIEFFGKGARFNAAPFVALLVLLGVLGLFFYIPPNQYQPYTCSFYSPCPPNTSNALSFFFINAGTTVIYGVSLSHGWVSLGMLFALPFAALAAKTERSWFAILAIVSVISIASDWVADMTANYIAVNLVGVEGSLMLGAVLAALSGAVITKGKWH